MKKIGSLIIIGLVMFSFTNCTSLEDKVKEYRGIKENIEKVQEEVVKGLISSDDGLKQITELESELNSFDIEVINQYFKEENFIKEIARKKVRAKRDSIKQSRINKKKALELKRLEERKARKEQARLKKEELERKREVEEMVRLEEEADRNAYISELKEKGIFIVDFSGQSYEINKKEWVDWKKSNKYDPDKDLIETKNMVRSMGAQKANGLANSLRRTLLKGINKEGVTFRTLQGIQMYDVITTGSTKFD